MLALQINVGYHDKIPFMIKNNIKYLKKYI